VWIGLKYWKSMATIVAGSLCRALTMTVSGVAMAVAMAMAMAGAGAGAAAAAAAAVTTASAAVTAVPGQELVRTYCSGCHREHAGEFERISAIRKTPEGWVMTLFRMRQVHGLVLDDGVRESIVRYLADTQGLAPSEAAAGRFALERRPNAKDIVLGPEIDVMCGRCHSLARVSLQRRDEAEWRKLAHTHVGQWASLEYSASGRDRPWWQIASGPLPGKLAALYPFSSTAWSDWKARPAQNLSGSWVVVGHVPGGKDFYGTARISVQTDGAYRADYRLADVTGFEFHGDSKAIVYTGYEWRGSAQIGDRSLREVYAVSEDGSRIAGRWFDADHAEEGGEWMAIREAAPPEVLAVFPQALRRGSTTTVTIIGNGLDAPSLPVSFGEAAVAKNVQREAHRIRALVTVAADAVPGLRRVSLGSAWGKLAVYATIDQIDVVPGYAIARLGGGRVDPVTAQFEALASTRLPSGELLSLGPVTAEWTSIPFDAEAKRTEDEKFAGHFDMRGRFLPSAAGPNPAREFSGDNVGNLTVLAHAEDGNRTVEGRGHLVVTVQRWITPPIY
jgi:quinohemoprotein amine dehydrogenase